MQLTDKEKMVVDKIRRETLGPVARHLNKKISLPISLRLARWKVHPNWVSFFNIALGYSTGFFVAQGTYGYCLLGGFLFQMASVFDGCDGELAKLRSMTSKFGEYLDTISDNGTLLSFFIGLLVAFAKNNATQTTVLVTLLLMGGLGVLFWQIIDFLKKNTNSASLATFDKVYLSKLPQEEDSWILKIVRYGRIFMRKDAFSLLFFVLALLGILPMLILLATFGIWFANGVLFYLQSRYPFRKIS